MLPLPKVAGPFQEHSRGIAAELAGMSYCRLALPDTLSGGLSIGSMPTTS